MNKTIKIGLCIILLLGLGGTGTAAVQWIKSSTQEQSSRPTIYPDSQLQDGEIMVYQFDNYDLTIVSFVGNFDFIYQPSQALSLKTLATESNYRYLINGSFFEASQEHAGWLSVLGQEKTPLKEDPQLSHIVQYNLNTGGLNFVEAQLFQPSTQETNIEFQSGPLIIDNNQVTTKYIEQSLNGLLPFRRTLLAYTEEDQRKYFMITENKVKLDDLAEYLLTLSVFAGKTLQVMNLDGGTSVALYSQTHPELNFNEAAILPILLGINREQR
ncbi:MAG: phosphodiester glycosidase family protein [Symploca sp. SIO2E6]|nr:phosphodiester glycosidase family protein [Symploca sp. SIO2E6]